MFIAQDCALKLEGNEWAAYESESNSSELQILTGCYGVVWLLAFSRPFVVTRAMSTRGSA
jgi:hypothetical protein